MKKTIKIFLIIFFIACFLLVVLGTGSGEEPRILIRDSGPDYKIFSLTVKVVNCPYCNFKTPFEIKEMDTEKICRDDINFLNRLFKIEGISSVSVEYYEVIIKRGRAFEWKSIEPHVLEVLKECFGANKDKVEIIRDPKAQSK